MVTEVLVWPIMVVSVVALLLFIVLYLQRLHRAAYESWEIRQREQLLPLFHAYISGDEALESFCQTAHKSLPVAEKLIIEFLYDLKGESRERLLQAVRHLGLVDRALRQLQSHRWTVRDLAAMRLGVYALEDTVPALTALLSDPRHEVRYTSARSLGMIQTPEAVDALIEILNYPEIVNTPRVLEIVQSMDNLVNEPIKRMLSSPEYNVDAKLLAIDLAGDTKDYSMVDMLLQVVRSSHKEKVVRALKSLGKIAAPQAIDQVIKLAEDRQWEVRAQALKAIGLIQIEEGIPLLLDNLTDSYYWVRHNAAEALSAFGDKGYEALVTARDSEDTFAKDIAHYYLSRMNNSNGNRLGSNGNEVAGHQEQNRLATSEST
ncbi:HEAT repeat domain-containing protein [bacterium]|nr:HEAT repeat domain-containing protein [bacterium]